MPKKRVIAAILVKDGWAVQSIGFARFLPVGRPEISARFFSAWGADEILLLDIRASEEGRTLDPELVSRVAGNVYVPLTVGGGIRSVEDVRCIVQAGADKVTINLGAHQVPEQVRTAAAAFGNQCIVGAMDVIRDESDRVLVYSKGGGTATTRDVTEYAQMLADMYVGEILVNSVDRDGMRTGFDIRAITAVAGGVRVPVIALGGAGEPSHLYEVLRLDDVSAAAAGNYFHFTEHAISVAKAYLRHQGLDVRLDSWADYSLFGFSESDGRITKRSEDQLNDEIFEFIPEEII